MNSRQLNLILLVLNLGLLGVVLYLIVGGNRGERAEADVVPGRVVTNTVTQIAVRKVNATNLLASLANRPLSWRALESTNFFIYAQNLRNFGCPEETVRDIIITDVAKVYAERRLLLRAKAPPPTFWQTSDSGAPGDSPELRTQLAELDQEQSQLIRDLLGVDLERELAKYTSSSTSVEKGALVSFLPEEKRQGVLEIQNRYAAEEEAIYESSHGLLLESDREALRRIQTQREAELARFLSADEMLAFQLYNSETANNLRVQLNGFQPSQDEFVQIFQLQKAYDDQFGQALDLSDDRAMANRARTEHAAQQALESELKRVLGPQRFGEYQRAQDGDYRALLQIADRYQLSPDVANSVYGMKLAAEGQKVRVESNPNLNDVQRAQMLATLAQETEKNVATVLGGNLYRDYQRGPGQWLSSLYFFDEENLPPEVPSPEPAQRTPILPPVPPGMLNSLPPGYRELLLNQQGPFPPAPNSPPR